jgi:hypothetical protein
MRIDAEARAALGELVVQWMEHPEDQGTNPAWPAGSTQDVKLQGVRRGRKLGHFLAAQDLSDLLSRMEVEPEPQSRWTHSDETRRALARWAGEE